MSRSDAFNIFDAILAATPLSDPWLHGFGEAPRYAADLDLLSQLLTVPVRAGKGSESGVLAKGVDSWLAHELRRSGFGTDEVWPRATLPRVMPRDVAALLEKLPRELSAEVRKRVNEMSSVTPSDARILGRAYEKQVDVAIARWDRGPELLLSTKTQVSSFGKNLGNRFEEAYGDAGNLRSRYPLASVGFFFVQRATILRDEPEAFERTKDMMRKLRDLGGADGYTATGLLLVDWDTSEIGEQTVRIEIDRVPEDLRPSQFMTAMLKQVIAATPVSQHVTVRELLERRDIPVLEEDLAADAGDLSSLS